MASPTKPLARIYTLGKTLNIIILWLQKENQQELDPELVKDFINLAVMDVSEIISGAGSDDYGKTTNITDEAASASATIIQSATYTNSTRNINKSAHGYTASDIGKRIVMWDGTTRAGAAEIESITDVDNFIVTKALGGDAAGTLNFAVLSAHTDTSVDLSSYKIAGITKIYDSINKEVIKVGDIKFDNIERFTQKNNKVYWYKHGQTLYLKAGSSVTGIGTLTMSYNSYPQLVTEETDYLDIRDNYMPLVIAMAKNYCLEHLGITAPESLTGVIANKTKDVRENILREKALLEGKNRGSV